MAEAGCIGGSSDAEAGPPAPVLTPTSPAEATVAPETPREGPTPAPANRPTAAPTATPPSTLEPTVIEHGNAKAVATEVVVGEAIAGAIDYEDDIDFLHFTATAGQLYQIDVALGTLDDSEVTLFESNGLRLASNDNHGDSLASRIVWEAPDSGDYYARVEAAFFARDGTGSYTLTISLSDIRDDHGNDRDSATAVAVGVDTQGTLEYEDDVDFFSFTATAGQLYQIDVALGTLDDSEVRLLGSGGWIVASNDDHGNSPASRIVWEAPDSGDYYAKVEASRSARDGTGSYTLTISLSDIQDDHANDTDSATAVAVGADIHGILDYEDDADFFRFTATAGQLYQIRRGPGNPGRL